MTTTKWYEKEEEPRIELSPNPELHQMLVRLREVKDQKELLDKEEKELVAKVKTLIDPGRYESPEVGLNVTLSQGKDRESVSKDTFKSAFKTALNGLSWPCRNPECTEEARLPHDAVAGAESKADADAITTSKGNLTLTITRAGE